MSDPEAPGQPNDNSHTVDFAILSEAMGNSAAIGNAPAQPEQPDPTQVGGKAIDPEPVAAPEPGEPDVQPGDIRKQLRSRRRVLAKEIKRLRKLEAEHDDITRALNAMGQTSAPVRDIRSARKA